MNIHSCFRIGIAVVGIAIICKELISLNHSADLGEERKLYIKYYCCPIKLEFSRVHA